MATAWRRGDKVRHAARPEWGLGRVQSAEALLHEGKPCQRVVVLFDRVGARTLSTAFADLRSADDLPAVSPDRPELHAINSPELSDSERTTMPVDEVPVQDLLLAIPEPATDPFSSPKSRLQATLNLYRFSDTGGSLLDWAAMQTGLKDPLSRFSRHELEQLFKRFQINLDNHLKKLIRDFKRQDPGMVEELTRAALPAAKNALRRLDIGR